MTQRARLRPSGWRPSPVNDGPQLTAGSCQQSEVDRHSSSTVRLLLCFILCPPSVISRQPSSVFNRPSSIVCLPLLAVRHASSVTSHQSFVIIRHRSSVCCLPLSSISHHPVRRRSAASRQPSSRQEHPRLTDPPHGRQPPAVTHLLSDGRRSAQNCRDHTPHRHRPVRPRSQLTGVSLNRNWTGYRTGAERLIGARIGAQVGLGFRGTRSYDAELITG